MDLDALTGCLASSACLVTQTTSGFIIGMLLFLVAVGLTLIFGVLKVVNFSHGAFYMFGAYFAMTAYQLTGSFALGGMLAGLAGALAAPVRSLTPGMGFSVLIESFIVTVIGGMGSILGALIGALLIGMIRSFGSLGFPLFTEGLMYLFMVIVLVSRPTGLFGKEVA